MREMERKHIIDGTFREAPLPTGDGAGDALARAVIDLACEAAIGLRPWSDVAGVAALGSRVSGAGEGERNGAVT